MPAAWSYMLAARPRGLGTTWTGVTIVADDEVRAILGLPDNVYHATTIPTAYYTGTTFRRAERIPLDDVVHFDRWGAGRRIRPSRRSPVRERNYKDDNHG